MSRYFLLFLLFQMLTCLGTNSAQEVNEYFLMKDKFLDHNRIYQPNTEIDLFRNGNKDDDSLKKKDVTLQFKIGIKFSDGEFPTRKAGIALGISYFGNLGNKWFLQPDFLFWSAKNNNSSDVFNVWDISLLCGYKIDIEKFSISLAAGPGGAKSNRGKDMMISLKYALQFHLNITKNQKMFLEIQRQLLGDLDVGGSDQNYNPFILSIGTRINI